MKKLILFVLCALSGLMVSAQSRWGITPEGGFAAVNRVGMGSSWRAGVKVGVGVSYQFEPGWIGLKSGLYYANRGYCNLHQLVSEELASSSSQSSFSESYEYI